MTLLTIGLWIVGICLILAVFSVVSQALEQKRAERRRVAAGLERHAAHIQELLSGFPPGYLNKELEMFLYDNILEIYEKLEHLDRHNPAYQETLQQLRKDQNALMQSPHTAQKQIALTTPHEIKEIKQRLKDFLVVIGMAVQNHSLALGQAKQFKQDIAKTMLSINLHSYRIAALHAESADKLQVAIHYHEQAQKLLIANSSSPNMMLENKSRIEEYSRLIKNLNEKLARQTAMLIAKNMANPSGINGSKPAGHIIINDESDPSKKKQIYD